LDLREVRESDDGRRRRRGAQAYIVDHDMMSKRLHG